METSSGFEFEFDRQRLDDMRVVELLCDVTDEKLDDFTRLCAIGRLIELLLGKAQKAALYEHIGASHEGRVPYRALEEELAEIMNSAGEDAEKN